MTFSEEIEALRSAVMAAPSPALRAMLAKAYSADEHFAEAAAEYELLLESGELKPADMVSACHAALNAGLLDLAGRLLNAAEKAGVVEGLASVRRRLDEGLAEAQVVRLVPLQGGRAAGQHAYRAEEAGLTFDAVGGLSDIKKIIHRTIILPRQRPDLYRKYGRKAGGGVLLYGPPGCGKTMLARATAGECCVPFLNVRIEEVLDPYLGMSERNLHEAFEAARAQAPAVLFLDEIDAIGFARRKMTGSAARSLVDQLLQELDAIGSNNTGLLILAATNAPWDVDDALRRPGRFDRSVFVPPPDHDARRRILELLLDDRLTRNVEVKRVAADTTLFSGADLTALVERATDRVIDEALDTGEEPPLTTDHLLAALAEMRPSTLEWLSRADNFVEFANRDETYADVEKYLKSREVRRARKR